METISDWDGIRNYVDGFLVKEFAKIPEDERSAISGETLYRMVLVMRRKDVQSPLKFARKIARNQALDWLRNCWNKKVDGLSDQEQELPSDVSGPGDATSAAQTTFARTAFLAAALHVRGKRDRAVILAKLDDVPSAELAESLGIVQNHVDHIKAVCKSDVTHLARMATAEWERTEAPRPAPSRVVSGLTVVWAGDRTRMRTSMRRSILTPDLLKELVVGADAFVLAIRWLPDVATPLFEPLVLQDPGTLATQLTRQLAPLASHDSTLRERVAVLVALFKRSGSVPLAHARSLLRNPPPQASAGVTKALQVQNPAVLRKLGEIMEEER